MSEPDDIWFHFQNISGPHIILQCAQCNFIPQEILKTIGNKLYDYKKSADVNEKIIYTKIKNLIMTKTKGQVITKNSTILN